MMELKFRILLLSQQIERKDLLFMGQQKSYLMMYSLIKVDRGSAYIFFRNIGYSRFGQIALAELLWR